MTQTVRAEALLATPPGTGAIAVVHLSGPDALSILTRVFRSTHFDIENTSPTILAEKFNAGRPRYGEFHDDGETIDDVIVASADDSNSSSFDICTHGGVRIVERVLQRLVECGATLIDGEKACERIWPASNQIELEAHNELIRTVTERAVGFLTWQRSNLAAFLGDLDCENEKGRADAYALLDAMHGRYSTAKLLTCSANVALVGPPNSGKSTLFNHLVGREATIVSARAGTTRDWVTANIEIAGVPITLIDTAGDHATPETLERLAIVSGTEQSSTADLRLLVVDASIPITRPTDLPFDLLTLNKCDLEPEKIPCEMFPELKRTPVSISAMTGAGIADLESAILDALGFGEWDDYQPAAFTFRQYSILDELLKKGDSSSRALQVAIKRLLFGSKWNDSGESVPIMS